jgi:NADPH-dependent 2,4-dienoyl-CoA reductase/sulfur reductase-like enzyme
MGRTARARRVRRRSAMQKFQLVIAGGGLTAARAIKSYREHGGLGKIALLTKEPDLPYHRPALSKRYLRGETSDAPFAENEAFYRDHGVDVLLATTVRGVDIPTRAVATSAGRFQYDKLLVATGARPRRLDVEARRSRVSTSCARFAIRRRSVRRRSLRSARSSSAADSSAWRWQPRCDT